MDAAFFWNDVSLTLMGKDHGLPNPLQGGPTFASRALAIVHAAMYDASNQIIGTHQPYQPDLPDFPGKGGDPASAITGAAESTLRLLYGKHKPFADLLNAELGRYSKEFGDPDPDSFDFGQQIGVLLHKARESDNSQQQRTRSLEFGFFANSQNGCPPNDGTPGKHKVDPWNPDQGCLGARWGEVVPFVIKAVETYDQIAPPDVNSDAYSQAFDQVLKVGANLDTARSLDQTEIGIFWAYDGAPELGPPMKLYNQLARAVAKKLGLSQEQSSRLFALVNLAMADAGIWCWHSKYLHMYWRPVVGIQEHPRPDKRVRRWQPLGAPRSNAPALTPNMAGDLEANLDLPLFRGRLTA